MGEGVCHLVSVPTIVDSTSYLSIVADVNFLSEEHRKINSSVPTWRYDLLFHKVLYMKLEDHLTHHMLITPRMLLRLFAVESVRFCNEILLR